MISSRPDTGVITDIRPLPEQRETEVPLLSWVAQVPARAVPHVDFGTRWTIPPRFDRHHRVSWVPTTGELYATDAGESRTRVLAVINSRATLDAVLVGWGHMGSAPQAPLAWVEDRVAQWQLTGR